jgi:hypothetical protein
VYYLLMFSILAYVVIFTIVVQKGYQESTSALATIVPTVKGSAVDTLTGKYYESVELSELLGDYLARFFEFVILQLIMHWNLERCLLRRISLKLQIRREASAMEVPMEVVAIAHLGV